MPKHMDVPKKVDDAKRNLRIAVATEFADLFIKESEKHIHGQPNQMPRAAAQTLRAIEQIDPIGDFTAERNQ